MKIRELRERDIFNGDSNGLNETLSCLFAEPIKSKDIMQEAIAYKRRKDFGLRTLVIELPGEPSFIVGTISYFINISFGHDNRAVIHIENLAVHPKYRKLLVGRTLVDRVIDLAKGANAYKIVLHSTENAVEFYKRFGFEIDIGMRLNLD